MPTLKTHLRKLPYLLLVLVCLLTVQVQAKNSQNDTGSTSTAGLQFTTIAPEATTQTKAVAAVAAKNQSVKPAAATPAKAALSLWTIFIAGFIGGLAALLLPCIFRCCR